MSKSEIYESITEYISRLKNVTDSVDEQGYTLSTKPARRKLSAIDGPFVETKEHLCGPLPQKGSS